MIQAVIYTGYGFDALETYLFTSPCSEAEFQLFLNNKSYFEGKIDISDITEMNVSRSVIKTPIQDNNLSSYITKNSKIKTFINVTRTKTAKH